jgi:hypothetical protein
MWLVSYSAWPSVSAFDSVASGDRSVGLDARRSAEVVHRPAAALWRAAIAEVITFPISLVFAAVT